MEAAVVGLIVFCGVSFAFWGGVGLLRYVAESYSGTWRQAGDMADRRPRGGCIVGAFFGIASALAFWFVLALTQIFVTALNSSLPIAPLLASAALLLFVAWLTLCYWGARLASQHVAAQPRVFSPDAISNAKQTQSVIHVAGALPLLLPAALAADIGLAPVGVGIALLLVLALAAANMGIRQP